jgi:hypothetical protein
MSSHWSLPDLQQSYARAKQRVNESEKRGATNTNRLKSFDFRRTERPRTTRIGESSTCLRKIDLPVRKRIGYSANSIGGAREE